MPHSVLSATLTSLLDHSLNRWLQLNADAPQTLARLHQKIIALDIQGLGITLYFFPSTQGIYTQTAYAGEPDAALSAPPATLLKLATAEESNALVLRSPQVKLSGSIGLLEQFMQLLSGANIDWEDILSQIVGDIVAYQSSEVIRKSQGWLHDSHQTMQQNMGEYLQEEQRVLPAQAEIHYYFAQVDELRTDTDRLAARIQRLQHITQ
ncbi:MAG TPA: Sterol-binding domain protein, partial [Thiothrix sp.]|nr:Sterol-binding domain protein [Thiothrix sp.]